MFQFPHLPLLAYVLSQEYPSLIRMGCPIRESPAKLARQQAEAYRSLAAPFFGSWRQGIHRAPLVAWPTLNHRQDLIQYSVVKVLFSTLSAVWCYSDRTLWHQPKNCYVLSCVVSVYHGHTEDSIHRPNMIVKYFFSHILEVCLNCRG